MSRHFATVCAVVVAWGLSAHGAERPKLVVVPFAAADGASDTAASKFTALVTEELKTRGDTIDVAPAPAIKAAPAERSGGGKGGPSPQALSALDAGRRAFDELRFEDAVKELRAGLDGLLADPSTCDFETILDAETKLAAAYFRMGEEKDAKTVLGELARLSPNHTLAGGFPPVFVRELEKAKKRLDKQPRGQISVEGPPGATAFIDGRDLGMVPVLEENIPAGLHYVKVEGGKGEKFGQAVEVKGAVARVKAVFGGGSDRAPVNTVPDPRIAALLDEGTRDRLSAYSKAAGADFALVGVVSRLSEAQLSAGTALFSVRKGGFVALAPQAFDPAVMTANTEAYKLVDELASKLSSFGAPASLPLALVAKPKTVVVAKVEPVKVEPKKTADALDVAAPPPRKVTVVPSDVEVKPKGQVRVLDGTSTVVDAEPRLGLEGTGEKPPEVKQAGVPAWVWVVTGAAVAGAAVGGYFGYTALTKPVTGTVTATW